MKKIYLYLWLSLTSLCSFAQQKDAFDILLDSAGISYTDLGFSPKAYWTRYPLPDDIPFMLHSFNDLLSEPDKIYDYVNTMAVAAEDFLNPKYLKKNSNSILRLAFYEGVMHQNSQFRAYSASLWAEPTETHPLLNAIKTLYDKTGWVFTYNRMEEPGEFPLNEKDLKIACQGLDPAIRVELAKAVINLTDAWKFSQTALRNVDYKQMVKCWRIRHLGETQYDGNEYYPQLEDVASAIDMNSMYYAGLKLAAVGELLANTLAGMKETRKDIDWKKQHFEWITPIGRIVVSGTGKNSHNYSDALLVVDLGGNDTYNGPAGANPSLEIPLSLYIDLDGDDRYINEDEFVPAQGAGLLGAGVLIDLEGDDLYRSKRLSQGAAMLGIGILADRNGNDTYEMWTSGQGAAYFGVGLAIDNTGNDTYNIWGDGQGYGGISGVGTLINGSGNDHYFAERDTSVIYRSDFWHSKKGEYNYTYVQGSGVGRRGDISDGHDWAGGMGTLIDLAGNDEYEAGGWSQGCGYWYAMGFLLDRKGNDTYKSTHWSQACGAHFAIGCLFDEGGNDKHINWEKLASGICFAHDYVIAILYNKGGNDIYKVHDDGFAYAINKAQAFMIDTEGDDTYITGSGHHFGWNNFDRNNPPTVSSVYHLYSTQAAFFADLAGNDTYLVEDYESGKQVPDTVIADKRIVFTPGHQKRKKLKSKKYYGIGWDMNGYHGKEIEIFRNKLRHLVKK